MGQCRGRYNIGRSCHISTPLVLELFNNGTQITNTFSWEEMSYLSEADQMHTPEYPIVDYGLIPESTSYIPVAHFQVLTHSFWNFAIHNRKKAGLFNQFFLATLMRRAHDKQKWWWTFISTQAMSAAHQAKATGLLLWRRWVHAISLSANSWESARTQKLVCLAIGLHSHSRQLFCFCSSHGYLKLRNITNLSGHTVPETRPWRAF